MWLREHDDSDNDVEEKHQDAQNGGGRAQSQPLKLGSHRWISRMRRMRMGQVAAE